MRSPASVLVRGSRLVRAEPERASNVAPRCPVGDRGARQPAGDLVELVDRCTDLGKRADTLIGRASLRIDRSNWPAAPSPELSLHKSGEICRDRDALGQRGLAKSAP